MSSLGITMGLTEILMFARDTHLQTLIFQESFTVIPNESSYARGQSYLKAR